MYIREMKLPVLYEDKDVVVVNKPAGLIVHPDGKNKEKSVVDWVLKEYPKAKNVGEPLILADGTKVLRPGIVHRLDKETSGVLLITKNKKAFEFYKELFQEHEMKKVYHAFVFGELKEDEGKIDRPIGRHSSDFRLWSAQRGARGTLRDALTEYRVIYKNKGFSFLAIKPKTGRTHQIRVHMKAINHPILGDEYYAPSHVHDLGFKRLALHAYSLSFITLKGEPVTVKAADPADFKVAAKRIGLVK